MSDYYDEDWEDYVCVDGYPEHLYVLVDERDGISVYVCDRCGAEIIEDEEDYY